MTDSLIVTLGWQKSFEQFVRSTEILSKSFIDANEQIIGAYNSLVMSERIIAIVRNFESKCSVYLDGFSFPVAEKTTANQFFAHIVFTHMPKRAKFLAIDEVTKKYVHKEANSLLALIMQVNQMTVIYTLQVLFCISKQDSYCIIYSSFNRLLN